MQARNSTGVTLYSKDVGYHGEQGFVCTLQVSLVNQALYDASPLAASTLQV